ncbi:MAG TPA: FkbM family methyltransferase [Vicinamibacterales bacterium]|nr:FkbM family methyltransferase [Vicinamibacterales bacterium]
MTDLVVGPAPWWLRGAASLVRTLPRGRYRAAQIISTRMRRPFWTTLPSDLGGTQFQCDLDDALMRDAFFIGRYEPQETRVLQHLLHPGMTMLDVGANWGYFTLVGAFLVGQAGRVIAIEADPPAVATLRRNVERNRLAQVTVLGIAASDEPGELAFEPYERHDRRRFGNFGVERVADGEETATAIRVAARPLDDVLDEAGIDRVDVIKMDIEGGEAAGLRGLARRLASGRVDRIVLELHPAALHKLGTSMDAVIAMLRGFGYEGWAIDHSFSANRHAANGNSSVTSLLRPLDAVHDLGDWPHVVWLRAGLAW